MLNGPVHFLCTYDLYERKHCKYFKCISSGSLLISRCLITANWIRVSWNTRSHGCHPQSHIHPNLCSAVYFYSPNIIDTICINWTIQPTIESNIVLQLFFQTYFLKYKASKLSYCLKSISTNGSKKNYA